MSNVNYPHRIRLRGAWQPEPPGAAGRARCRRRFGYPGRIDDYERVWLTFAGAPGGAAVWLNGQLLGRHGQDVTEFEHEVTPLLLSRNEVTVEADSFPAGGTGEVALEVRRAAFLRGVQARLLAEEGKERLEVVGEVVGVAERPLEVYVVLGRSTVAYGLAAAAPEGRPFALTSEELPPDRGPGPWPVRVDLVDGAVIWYTVEQSVGSPAAAGE